jgi:ABC-type lipopolysaccharide export system ATPase subunit
MLLDEPFAGIDPLSIGDIRHLVKDLKGRGIGVLITDHNVRETLDICDRATIIYGGQVLFAGSPEALVADEMCAASIWARTFHCDGSGGWSLMSARGARAWRWGRGWICGNPSRW